MRYKLTIEYDGSRYAGWQFQKNARSIQGELLEKAYHIFSTNQLEVYGAGRTDTGVHARGQVAHLDAPSRITPDQIKMRFNDELPSDINILSVETVHPKFHARFDAKQRSYTYQISKRRDAFSKKYVWWIKDPLNTMMMRAAAMQLVGFHDFKSFGDTEKEGQSTLVEMTKVEIIEDDDRIYVHIRGSHFLWKMVRRIIGILVEVGRGNMTPDDVAHLLKIHSREPAKYTAPPSGLFLEKVEY
jgi:tRNA pseudouridine38-40 synthase